LALLSLGQAVGVEKLHQRRHLKHQAQANEQSVQPQAVTPPPAPAAITSESLIEQSAGESTEILHSLQTLLEQKKASSAAAAAKLQAAAAHTLQVEAALAAKHQELSQHNAMLAQLERCLAQGPAAERAAEAEKEFKAHEGSLLEARAGVEERAQQLAEHAEELEQQRDDLEQRLAELESRELHMKQTRAHLFSQQSLLEKQAAQVDLKEKQIEAIVKERVEKIIRAKMESVRHEVESQAEERLSAVKAAMAAQAAQLLKDQETSLMEERAADISNTHEMKDLTSVDENPYLHLAETGEQQQEQQEMEDEV